MKSHFSYLIRSWKLNLSTRIFHKTKVVVCTFWFIYLGSAVGTEIIILLIRLLKSNQTKNHQSAFSAADCVNAKIENYTSARINAIVHCGKCRPVWVILYEAGRPHEGCKTNVCLRFGYCHVRVPPSKLHRLLMALAISTYLPISLLALNNEVRALEPGLVFMGGDSCSEGHGFQSQHHILNGIFFTYICCKNCNDVCLKRPKIDDKRGRGWPI